MMRTVEWMRGGTRFFLAEVDRLDDDELDAPSALPDWTRRHVIAHVARNAEALGRLLDWASTGVETPSTPASSNARPTSKRPHASRRTSSAPT